MICLCVACTKFQWNSGFFISQYSEGDMQRRQDDPEYLLVETSIPIPDSEDRLVIADCHTRIPACTVSEPIFEMPDTSRGDVIYLETLVKQIGTRKTRYAIVEDITCVAEHNDRGFAGIARNNAFHRIETEINPARGEHAIEKVAAAIAVLEGVRCPDGSIILLEELGNRMPIKNERSLLAHRFSRHECGMAYYLHRRELPFVINGQVYYIIVGWLMHFLDLKSRAKK